MAPKPAPVRTDYLGPMPEATEDKRLFLLDAFALIYRAYFSFIKTPRINSQRLNTSAAFGFTTTLLDLIKREAPTHIAVVFDTSAPTERHEVLLDYKANRQEMPDDIRSNIPYIRRIIEAFNIPILEADGYEADDVIGTLAKKAEREGFTTFMVTRTRISGSSSRTRSSCTSPVAEDRRRRSSAPRRSASAGDLRARTR